MKKLFCILTAIFACHIALYAQMGKLFDANQQLSSSFTSQVYLDHDGFIWSATRNGLNKYDGYQFRIYKKEEQNGTGMASNYVNCIIQDSKGLFYLGMWGALQTYDGVRCRDVEVKDLQGRIMKPYITCFAERKNGEMWVGTSGVGVLKVDDQQHAQQVGGPLKDIHTANHMMEDSRGRMWIVTQRHGLLCFNGQRVQAFMTNTSAASHLTKVSEDKQGNIYVGTSSEGLFRLNGNQFEPVPGTQGKSVSELYCNRNGKLMIGYDGAGLAIYDPKTGSIADNPFFSQEIDLTGCKIYSITEDKSGNYWFGILQKGLYMQPAASTGFNYMGYKLGAHNKIGQACVISTFIDSQRRIWIGTDRDGLYCFDANQQLKKHYKDHFPATVMTVCEDKSGRIWIGSYNDGGGWIEPNSGQYHPLTMAQMSNVSIFDVEVDKENRLWMATMGQGLVMIDLQTNEMKAYTARNGASDNPAINSITNDYISQLSLSPDGKRVYVATTMGVCCLDIDRQSWTNFFGKNCLNYGTPVRIAREFSGSLWIGTNNGLYRYSLSNKQLQRYTAEQGVADYGIASIEQDADGRLWISTDHGLCCHDPKEGITQNYFIDNGLQSNEFSDGASWSAPNGTMVFGGVGGVTWFSPSEIKQAKWDASVQLTAFTINGEPVNSETISGRFHVTDTTAIASNRFELGYHDNSFAIQFSTLTYDNPEHITYLYSINGESFVRLQPGVNEITFSHLAPGTYKFRVKAERNSQETALREFTVVVHSPWYRSTLAYLIYLLLAAFAVWQYLKIQRRKQQDRLRLQEHMHAEEMGEAKLRFFMNISHEIRTPMTLIITPLLSLMKEDTDPNRRSVYQTIKRNAERILNLINQMMDLRKIDKGMMRMHMQETDLVGFVQEIHTLFEHQADAKQIALTYEHDSDTLPVWIDRKNFDKVVVNILSNAFKYTPIGGKIDIRVSHDDQNATITFSNNGENIPEDKIDKIFERFYQTTSEANDRNVGTGIGLDLTRSLVELHYGAISARNLKQGCEFVVSIPLGNAHLKPEEMVADDKQDEPAQYMPELEELMQPIDIEEKTSDERGTVVIAEDDDEIRNYLASELAQDFEVKTCANGREALAEVYRTMPDLVVSDIMMPELDGNALCSQLKSNQSTNHIPIILLTAKNRDEDKLESLETGADAYIVKPFNMDILRRTIINLVNSHRLLKMKYRQTEKLEERVEEVKMKSPDEKLLERVMSTVNRNMNNSDLSVDMIASEVGISRVHLHRKMKELTGQTPHDFIRSIRLKQAASLLANQNMNITEVVYACGFSNAASFSTMFKSVYGMSPREYMKEHHNK